MRGDAGKSEDVTTSDDVSVSLVTPHPFSENRGETCFQMNGNLRSHGERLERRKSETPSSSVAECIES